MVRQVGRAFALHAQPAKAVRANHLDLKLLLEELTQPRQTERRTQTDQLRQVSIAIVKLLAIESA